ncbi:6-phosphogluconolactonase [Planctomycetes bacterium Pan216]|uniref:6-phosphogluconolactonase n=1 Tax=Kolteria novifilia TaxID=2527975 RepID=A0A518B7M6_9BACT|nr:6-phosphogluconolactonase [Planctomycetes bacterium Pan216]
MKTFLRSIVVSAVFATPLLAAEPRLVFEDDFSRNEVGNAWHSPIGSFRIEEGALRGAEDPKDGHGAVTQTYLDFADLILEFRFQFQGSKSFNVVIDDRYYRGAHAGHLCRVSVSKSQILLRDDKTGFMENANFKLLRDKAKRAPTLTKLADKQKQIPVKLESGKWYRLKVSMIGETLSVALDGNTLGTLKTPGIGHLTKTDFGFTVVGDGLLIDDVRAWLPASTGETLIYGPSRATKELLTARMSTATGTPTLEVIHREPLGLAAGPVAYHPEHRVIYAVDSRPKAKGGGRGYVIKLNDDGAVAEKVPFETAHGYSYLGLDRSRRFLLGGSYSEGHSDVFALGDQGIPGKVVSNRFEGRDKAHAILTTPDNRFAYVPYVKDQNALHQYRFNKKTGELTPHPKGMITPPNGIGPRHVAFHPTRPYVFFSNEQGLGASSFRLEKDGSLTFVESAAVQDGPPQAGQTASDIALTRGGNYLFTGLRGGKPGQPNAICRYKVGGDGSLEFLGMTEADTIPWCLQLTPDERHLLVSATKAGTLTAYEVGDDGGLSKAASIPWDKQIYDMIVLSTTEH